LLIYCLVIDKEKENPEEYNSLKSIIRDCKVNIIISICKKL